MIIWRIFLIPVFLYLTACQQGEKHKPNILWIIADDLGTDLECYGNISVHTPNLNKLANEGILFTQLHTVTSVCSSSRSSLMTGMYPVSIDCQQHRTRFKKSLPEGILPVTEYFRKAGYYVCNGDATRVNEKGKNDFNFVFNDSTIFDGPDWSGRKQGQPFFAQMQIHYPHRVFEPDTVHPVNRDGLEIPPVYPDHPLTREDWALYLESVQHADRYVGKVMNRLEKEKLLNNTIVLFFGDQGRPMVRAKQFLYDEGTNTPFIVRFPDGIHAGKYDTSLISNIDIPATSLALAGIDVPGYMHGHNIFSENKRDFVFCMRDRCDETVDRIRSVRNDQFKYIRNFYPDRPYTQFNKYKVVRYPTLTLMKVMYEKGELTPEQAVFMGSERPAEELYNLYDDPFEMNNEATNPYFNMELNRMRTALDRWLDEYDMGTYPEDSTEIDYWTRYFDKDYRYAMNVYNLPPDISDEDFLEWWKNKLGIE